MAGRPRFLPRDWPSYTGWALPPVRPHPLEDPARRDGDDPWDRLLFILTTAQHGDFSHGDALVELVLDQLPELDDSDVCELAGSTLDHTQLRRLFPLIGTERSFAVSVIANASYWLDFAEAAYTNRFDSELRPLFFSQFIEARDVEPGLELSGPHGEYLDRVRARIGELRGAHAGIDHFLYGEPLHPRVMLAELRAHAGLDDDGLWEASASINEALRRFEGLTGVGFAQVVFPNATWGEVIREEPLPGGLTRIQMDPTGELRVDRDALDRSVARYEQLDLDRFEPGRRYFFGHPLGGSSS